MNNGFGIVQKIRIEGVLCVAGEGGKRPVAGQAGVELGLGPLGLARKLLALAGTEWESLGQLAGREVGGDSWLFWAQSVSVHHIQTYITSAVSSNNVVQYPKRRANPSLVVSFSEILTRRRGN